MVYLLTMMIFYSYVKLPEGKYSRDSVNNIAMI